MIRECLNMATNSITRKGYWIVLTISVTLFSKVDCKQGYGYKKHHSSPGYNYEPPEVINNDPPSQFGYQYPVGNPPLFDETTSNPQPPYLYGPPTLDLPTPNVTVPPFQNDIPDYPAYIPPPGTLQPPIYDPPLPPEDDYPNNNQYLPPTNLYETPNTVISSRIKVSNMSCLDTPLGLGGHFRATMTFSRSLATLPLVDDAPSDCITGSGDIFQLELDGDRMRRCGVRFCSNGVNMCVSIRMPTVRGIKLPEDGLMTLRCRPQERVVAHTKQLRINSQNSVAQARSALTSATVVTGGSQRGFESQVGLFRRAAVRSGTTDSPGDFSRSVGPGQPVILGEDLMLRASVRDGDGWKYSRLGDVTVHHVASGGRTVRQRAVTLLDSAGCRDPRTRAICPSDPVQPTPLVTTFGLRAFMFQGMQNGDEMLMSVRIIACLNYEDCHSKTRTCDEKSVRSARLKRQTNSTIPSASKTTSDFQSYLEFTVLNSLSDSSAIQRETETDNGNSGNRENSSANIPMLHQSKAFNVAIAVSGASLAIITGSCLLISYARKKY